MGGRRSQSKYWLVLKTKQASSRDALLNVRNQAFEYFHLTFRARALRGVRKVTALFPYYLIVRVDDRKQDWKVLAHTKGVTAVVGRVHDDEVRYLKSVTEKTDEGVYRFTDPDCESPRFSPGATVEGKRGLFEGKYGEYRGLVGSNAARVRVLFSFLGRDAEFEVRADDLISVQLPVTA